MRTAIVSDLHLGSASGEDLASDPAIRSTLLAEIGKADRVILLGDVLELFELPLPVVLESARPFFEELGEAMAGRPVVLVPGNHDHRLAEPLLERLALEGRALELEQHAEPTGEAAERIAAWLGGARPEIAYPGIWLREDVYATHGHYMDCHRRVPRLECIAAAMTMRAFGPLPERARPADYERVLRPVYGLGFGLAQGGLARGLTRPSERAWRTVAGPNGSGGRGRRAVLDAGVKAGAWSLNRLLRADFDPDLSRDSVSRNGIAAATEMSQRLEVDSAHTITGHTHRGGPDQDDAEWVLPGGGCLHNSGSWIFASAFHHPGAPPGPFWPGTVTWVEDDGPPRRTRLLLDYSREELRLAVGRLASVSR